MNVSMTGRVAGIVKGGVKEEIKTGKNGEFKSVQFLFTLACPRPYSREVSNTDGTTSKITDADFFLCKVNGEFAHSVAANINLKDDAGKLISRHLELYGHFETYRQKVTLKQPVEIAGVNYEVELTSRNDSECVTATIFVVDKLTYLDKNPVRSAVTAVGTPTATATAIPIPTPVAAVTSAPVQTPVAAPAPAVIPGMTNEQLMALMALISNPVAPAANTAIPNVTLPDTSNIGCEIPFATGAVTGSPFVA